jgi:hypothetical protein
MATQRMEGEAKQEGMVRPQSKKKRQEENKIMYSPQLVPSQAAPRGWHRLSVSDQVPWPVLIEIRQSISGKSGIRIKDVVGCVFAVVTVVRSM